MLGKAIFLLQANKREPLIALGYHQGTKKIIAMIKTWHPDDVTVNREVLKL